MTILKYPDHWLSLQLPDRKRQNSYLLIPLYHENKRGIKAGYAKFETFPIWNLPLKHPVNLAYEAATADLNDVNMIDPFHLEAYGKTTIHTTVMWIFSCIKCYF